VYGVEKLMITEVDVTKSGQWQGVEQPAPKVTFSHLTSGMAIAQLCNEVDGLDVTTGVHDGTCLCLSDSWVRGAHIEAGDLTRFPLDLRWAKEK
jgi:hypothetical protein